MARFDGQGPPRALVVLCVAALLALGCQASFATIVTLPPTPTANGINGAYFFAQDVQSSGTGVFDPFVRIQNSPTEQGYNTDSNKPWADEKTGIWTHSIRVSAIPIVEYNGDWYFDFRCDINQTKDKGTEGAWITLDQVKLYWSNDPGAPTFNTAPGSAPAWNLVYDLDAGGDNWVNVNTYFDPGSGKDDLQMLVPVGVFAGHYNSYLLFYSQFGPGTTGTPKFDSEDGFEEWGIRGDTFVPEPSSMLLMGLALGGGALAKFRRRKRAV